MNVDDKVSVEAILDVLMLSLAKKLYLFPLKKNENNAKYSGFSLLAKNLMENRFLLRNILTDDLDFFEEYLWPLN